MKTFAFVALFVVAGCSKTMASSEIDPNTTIVFVDTGPDRPFLRAQERLFREQSFLQLYVAVLQNGRAETERKVFCREGFQVMGRNWALNYQIERIAYFQEVEKLSSYLFQYGMAKHCWKGPPEDRQEMIYRGEHIIATFDPLGILDLDGVVGWETGVSERIGFMIR